MSTTTAAPTGIDALIADYVAAWGARDAELTAKHTYLDWQAAPDQLGL